MERTHQPTTEATLLGRMDQTVREIPAGAFVRRMAFSDVTYPRSQEELKAMGGFALLLVTALTHEESELPVSRVTVRIGDQTAELVPVTARRSELGPGRRADALGKFRYDGVYLMPVFVTRAPAEVVAYLGKGTIPLTLLRFPAARAEDDYPASLDFDWDPYDPQMEALRRLLDEEIPAIGSSGVGGTAK
jgi:hypothetical protein